MAVPADFAADADADVRPDVLVPAVLVVPQSDPGS
jgi:hypothetical protein